jgi:hypothetical protein
MVFAPRFERIEEELEDGCFLNADVQPGDTALIDFCVNNAIMGTEGSQHPCPDQRVALIC